MRVTTVNVNGVRAAHRRGGLAWLAGCGADVIALQEVRATGAQLRVTLESGGLGAWHVAHDEGPDRGRAGVALLTRSEPVRATADLGAEEFLGSGRWVEVDVPSPLGPVTVASTYVHTGEAGTGRQDEKYRFLDAVEAQMRAWAADGAHAVVTGDLNVAHREDDLKNWRGNRARSGFLPDERAYLDRWVGAGAWVDVHRALHGPGPGPYTWWSWRGRAFDNDAGWRIDYHLASAALAGRATAAEVGRAPAYAERWSSATPSGGATTPR